MNDFTKEELEGILEGLQIIDSDPGIRPKIYWKDSLKEKLQSMIDNYCEHEPSDKYFEIFKWKLCSKCGVEYK